MAALWTWAARRHPLWARLLRAVAAVDRPHPLDAASAVDAARRGDAGGWDWLFDRFHRTVVRYAMVRLGDLGEAEDVAQEVFVAAVGGIHRLRESSEGGLEAWLLGIARFKVTDRIRRRRRDGVSGSVEAVTAGPDAAEVAVSRIGTAELRRALEGLTEEQRDVVIRRFVLDHSLEQVAGATGRSVNAVKAMQHRALAQLGRLVEEAAA